MKRTINLIAIFFLFLFLTGCAGAGDWKYTDLPGDYELLRTSANNINLAKADPESDVLANNIIEGYITQFIVSGDYILVTNEKDDSMLYYIVNAKDDTIQEFESEDELFDVANQCGITSELEWIKTSDVEHEYE
ncbi:MAG: hypothetical protein ACI4ES_07610 [Roseburia sp.]